MEARPVHYKGGRGYFTADGFFQIRKATDKWYINTTDHLKVNRPDLYDRYIKSGKGLFPTRRAAIESIQLALGDECVPYPIRSKGWRVYCTPDNLFFFKKQHNDQWKITVTSRCQQLHEDVYNTAIENGIHQLKFDTRKEAIDLLESFLAVEVNTH